VPALERIIDAMPMAKLNVLHWHMTDTQSFPVASRALPELSRAGAFSAAERYSWGEMGALVEFARARGVRVVPELDVPGHSASWAKSHPEVIDPHSPTHPLTHSPPPTPTRHSLPPATHGHRGTVHRLARARSRAHTHAHAHTHTRARAHTRTHTHAHAYMHTRTHTHARARALTHTPLEHTNTQPAPSSSQRFPDRGEGAQRHFELRRLS
jgi:hypothetical protein